MCLLYSLFSRLVIPETRNDTLEQIEQHWRSLLERRTSGGFPAVRS
jgi:hypothetical protein